MPRSLRVSIKASESITLIGEKGFGLDLVEQRLDRLCDIGRLAGRERQRHGVAERIDNGVDLGRQPAAGICRWLDLRRLFFSALRYVGGRGRWLNRSTCTRHSGIKRRKGLEICAQKHQLSHHLRKRLCCRFPVAIALGQDHAMECRFGIDKGWHRQTSGMSAAVPPTWPSRPGRKSPGSLSIGRRARRSVASVGLPIADSS